MKNQTKIIILRHGHSLGNLSRTFLGHTDLDLSELGYKQVNATAEHLKNEKIDIIYSSDLLRAYNSALPNAKIRGIEVRTSKNFREVYAGEWENMPVDDIIAKWGRVMFYDEWVNNFGCFTLPGGESIKDSGIRFFNELSSICEENEGKTILVSSHAAVIRAFWAIISDIPSEDISKRLPFATNASYSVLYYENGFFTPFEYSIDGHLLDVGITKVNLI